VGASLAYLISGKGRRTESAIAAAKRSAAACLACLPAPSPLLMPAQDLKSGSLTRLASSGGTIRRRFTLLALSILMTGAAGAVMAALLAVNGLSILEWTAFILFLMLFGWIAFGFISALGGFWEAWTAPDLSDSDVSPRIITRTALLAPTYNEDPGRILSAIQAMYEELAERGVADLYDFFVLSDTRDDAIASAEATGVLRLRTRLGPQAGVFYRRRAQNTDRKAGNISDWVKRFGGAYPFMMILDADSLMSGDAIIRLTAAMEKDARLGLLQTAPTIVNAETPFARVQQFASRAYGPMMAAGQHWWSGSEGNYWGHNAILRTRAFSAHAGLPHLPGARPFGGHIMSHDFVEAALLRRGGWKVRLAAGLPGSFEETPPTILDMAIRDRRWCQGNLQHIGVVAASGLHWVSRLHLIRGISSYLTSPLWLFLLLTGTGVWVEESGSQLMIAGPSAVWLFGVTMSLLIAPKVLAGLLATRRASSRRAFGGAGRLWLSLVCEVILSALIAPVLMLMQSMAVFDVLIGRDSGWATQRRDPGRMSRKDAWKAHGAHVGIGLVGAALACMLDPAMLWWASPVYLGLILSAPLSLLLSQPALGRIFQATGLFVTPEERQPPAVVARAAELRESYDREQGLRWQIELLMRKSTPIYELRPVRMRRREEALYLAAG
jgi:membrane glycosyltransferase